MTNPLIWYKPVVDWLPYGDISRPRFSTSMAEREERIWAELATVLDSQPDIEGRALLRLVVTRLAAAEQWIADCDAHIKWDQTHKEESGGG